MLRSRSRRAERASDPGPRSADPAQEAVGLAVWLRERATTGAVGNLVAFTLLAATAASRAAHGVLSPAGLVAVVVGAAVAATTTGWVAGFYEGADAALHGRVTGVRPAAVDVAAGRGLWRAALSWASAAALWAAAGAVVLAAVLRDHSAPFPVLAVALLAIAAPAAVVVDLAARATGAAAGAAMRAHGLVPVNLLRRAWGDLALPVAAVQAVVNAGAAWVLFHSAAADGTLTKGEAFADAPLVAAILASLFGTLGARWGAVDAAAGRILVEAPHPDSPAPARRRPFGPQALVYAGGLAVAATSLAGLVVPAAPSVLRVALVRGLLSGGLALVACALGVVRGAANATPLDLGDRLAPLPAPVRARRLARVLASPAGASPVVAVPALAAVPLGLGDRLPRLPAPVRGRRLAGASAAVAVLALAATPLVEAPQPAAAQVLDGLGLVGELEALGVRVEYDLPLPAGTGSAPQVVGAVRRTNGGEVANGIAAAPTRFDAVVGGTVANPDKESGTGDESRLPQSECAYPGPLADIAFTFPADARPDTAGSPPVGWSSAQCGAGPALDLNATAASPDEVLALGPALSVAGGLAAATAGPVQGTLSAVASARAGGVSILDGLVRVDEVIARGESHTDGRPGGATTSASVDLVGVSVAGTRFDVRGGDLVVDGQTLPADGGAAQATLRALSAALAPSGCGVTLLDSPAAYPQGFLFARPVPELGVADDGSLAASMAGGLLVQCDLPADLSAPTGFSPQRMQVVLGFAYTSVSARADIGGFGLGDLAGGTPLGGSGGGLAPSAVAPSVPGGAISSPAGDEAVATPTGATVPPSPGPVGASTISERIRLVAANFAAGRPWVWLAALALWLILTHRGLERVRHTIAGAMQ